MIVNNVGKSSFTYKLLCKKFETKVFNNFPSSIALFHEYKKEETPSTSNDNVVFTSTFNRQTKFIPFNFKSNYLSFDSASNLNMYCCGPTVYDHSHLGHAISYIRCDLVRRTLKTFGNLNLFFAMNITDIDDKIIMKSNQTGTNYQDLSHLYYKSFVEDLSSLNIEPPDAFLKVTENIDVICDYIRKIYEKGFAYHSSETGDLNFDYETFTRSFKIENDFKSETGKNPTDKSKGKRSPKDFALWKQAKPGEPKWNLKLESDLTIDGRPGMLLN